MTLKDKKHRIIFIDLMRAFAVLQMVQGHTINVLLAEQSRNPELPVFAVWHFMRGMTAPIFMFTAGTVFTYLFKMVNKPFEENVRVKKGIKRGLLLIFIGYLLRYPTWTIFDFSGVSEYSWKIFFGVDVLHLIGISLLTLLLLLFLSEKIKLNDYFIFSTAAASIFILSPFVYRVEWADLMPNLLAGYFYSGTGSLFPFFPWAGYVIAGGVLGSYLGQHPLAFKTAKFSLLLAVIGSGLILASLLGNYISTALGIPIYNSQVSPNIIMFRIGFVLLLNSLLSYISLNVERIPNLLIVIGRNTLLIYVIHLLILYGSAWNPGINKFWGRSFDGWMSFAGALAMVTLMTIVVIVLHKFKMRNKQLVT